MVDDSHAVGFVGATGRGTPELCGVAGRVDILTGTLGKALGGASGGYTSGRREVVEMLRQRSRPYLFSNTLAPVIAAASLTALDLVETGDDAAARGSTATPRSFRREMAALGFTLAGRGHPIIPVMLGDARLAQDFADADARPRHLRDRLLLPGGAARPGAHPHPDVGRARPQDVVAPIAAFAKVGRELGSDPMTEHDDGAGQGAARARALDAGGAGPRARPERRADPGGEERHLRHRRPHLELGRLGGGDRAGADGGRPRVRRRVADIGAAVTRFRPASGSRARATSSAASAATAAPAAATSAATRWASASTAPAPSPSTSASPSATSSAIPDDIPDEIAAIFDPFGNAVHTALSFDLVGEDVLVTGAGPIGIMGALVAKRAGARKVVITDINPCRLDLAAAWASTTSSTPRARTSPT